MFYHTKKLQYFKPPEKPNPVYAMKIQELIGGTFGEITVMTRNDVHSTNPWLTWHLGGSLN